MNTENKQRKRNGRQILGWGLAVFGSMCAGLVIRNVIVFIVQWSIEYGCEDGICFIWILFSLPFLVIGVPSLVFGLRIILTGEKERGRIWGWVLLIFGAWFILFEFIFLIPGLLQFSLVETYLDDIGYLITGSLLIICGIWLIIRKRKMAPLTPGSPDDLPGGG